jgi:copper(I)-binding protein
MRKTLAALSILVLAACGGQTVSLTVENAQYRPPLVDGATGVAYFSITSNIDDRIVGVSSPQAKAVEIHESTSGSGMAGMEKRDGVDLPAGKPVTFASGGLHLMVIDPLPQSANATFPIQITLESGRAETISFSGASPTP